MTKLKSKKLTKSTFAVIIMAIIMVAMIAFGGTYAYFTATSSPDEKTVSVGYLKIKDNNAINAINVTNIFPTETLVDAKAVEISVQTNDDKGNYVAVKVQFDFYNYNGEKIEMPYDDLDDNGKLTFTDTNENGKRDYGEASTESWDANGDGYWDEDDTEKKTKPTKAHEKYKYKTYSGTTSKAVNADGTPKDGTITSSDTSLATLPADTLGEYDYFHTKASYDKMLEKYLADLKDYNTKSAQARLLSSLNTDASVITTSTEYNAADYAFTYGIKDSGTKKYAWNVLTLEDHADLTDEPVGRQQGIYICVDGAGSDNLLAVGAASDMDADGDYKDGEESGTITLVLNKREFSVPAEVSDNWDEGYQYSDITPDNGANDPVDNYAQHSEAGLMNGTIVISLQAFSIQATGFETDQKLAKHELYNALMSKWEEPSAPGTGSTPDDQGTTW